MSSLFHSVKPGDTVHYSTPQGQYGKGKVVLRYDTHVVVNRGKGQPQVVNDTNYVKHERGGKVVGALLSKLAAHDKYLKGVASTKASNAVAKAVSPYKKVGDPQMNASKAFGWTKTNEMRNPAGPYGGHPYDWDPELRKAIFAGMAKKNGKSKGPKDTGRDYKPNKLGPPPRRGTTSEDASEAEGRASRVSKTKNKAKSKKLHELTTATLKAAKRHAGAKLAMKKIAKAYEETVVEGEGAAKARAGERSWTSDLADKSPNLAKGAGKVQPGYHYRAGGKTVSVHDHPQDALSAYKKGGSVGKIVHVKEGVETDVTTQILSEDKVKQAAQKAIALSRKNVKGNKHVDTQPSLDLQDKGTSGPIEGSEGDRNGTL